MRISTRAATAAGFALTLLLSLNCNFAIAQQSAVAINTSTAAPTAASTYQTPSSTTASMTDSPTAPPLHAATCGTIGPQGDAVTVNPISDNTTEKPLAISNDALTVGKFDGGLFLRSVSSGIDQFKGKIAEKAFSFVESLQHAGPKDSSVTAPSGYTMIRQPASVSPVVY